MQTPGAQQAQSESINLVGRDAVCQWLQSRICSLVHQTSVRQVWICDDHFEGWPLGEPQTQEGLTIWLRQPGRQVGVLARDFEALARAQPRFVRWRRDWLHRVNGWQAEDPALAWPQVAWLDERAAMCWLSRPAWRAQVSLNQLRVAQMRQELDAFLQRCVSAWPGSPLGL
jgi:hypothetical protein